MSTSSWDPYGPTGGNIAHVPSSANSSVASGHVHHQHYMTTSTTGTPSSSTSSIAGSSSSSGSSSLPPGPAPVPSHPVTSTSHTYPVSGYPPHITTHGQNHGSHVTPPFTTAPGAPVIPFPSAHSSTTTSTPSSNAYPLKQPVLVPVLPGTAPLPPPLLMTNPPPSGSAPMTPGGPVPQTPTGPPAPFANNATPGAPGQDLDLPAELASVGWRKFWSKRENRFYFFNINSAESMWDLPPLPGRHPPTQQHGAYDPLTDPLGITCANGPASANSNLKRRASSGEQLSSPAAKKFILAGPWDLEVSSNACSAESIVQNAYLLPPHPEVELQRAQLIAKLRQCYQQSCQSREGIDAPKESLNKWIMERKIFDLRGIDPVFPSCDSPDGVVSPVMFKEIMNDVPMKVVKPRFTGDARKQLAKYTESCKRIIETRATTSEARKLVKWKVEETVSWLQKTVGAPYEAFQERLAHLKQTCQPHVHAAAKSSVEGICRKMSALAKQYGHSTRETHLKFFNNPQNVKRNEPEKGRYRCHPILCGGYVLSEKLPPIDYIPQQDKDHVLLKYKNDIVRISPLFLQKLEQLYRYNCLDDRKFESFLVRCYCLLRRYNSFCEEFTSSANKTQSSLPVTVFESIQRNFGVTFECFASPLNCYFRQFCSAFPDVDGYFGSRGTFLAYKPVCGSFQVNPPFSEELIDATITHIEELLAGTKEPMSFIVFVPEWTTDDKGNNSSNNDPVDCPWIKRLENSRWQRKLVRILAFEHEFRHARQHLIPKAEVNVRATHNTVIFWLQNNAGHEEWKPTDDKVESLTDAYRPGRERERDRQELLAPERQNPHQADKAVAAAVAAMNST